jgi:hypothetical protein
LGQTDHKLLPNCKGAIFIQAGIELAQLRDCNTMQERHLQTTIPFDDCIHDAPVGSRRSSEKLRLRRGASPMEGEGDAEEKQKGDG